MRPFVVVEEVRAAGTTISLARRDEEWVVRVGVSTLMSSRMHGSEEAMAEVALVRCPAAKRILVGGLGLGYTLRETLDRAPRDAEIVVSELFPAVVAWNRTHVAHLAGRPLDDARVTVHEGDVGALLAASAGRFDAILLDVDNGPAAFTRASNDGLYSARGTATLARALRTGGVAVVWSRGDDTRYTSALAHAGLASEVVAAGAVSSPAGDAKKGKARGGRHVLFVGKKP